MLSARAVRSISSENGPIGKIGVVRPGLLADMLIVDANPLENLKVLYGTGWFRLNDSTGNFAQDNIFAACNQGGGGTGYSVTFGHNSPGDCSGSPAITSAGWYRSVLAFADENVAENRLYLREVS